MKPRRTMNHRWKFYAWEGLGNELRRCTRGCGWERKRGQSGTGYRHSGGKVIPAMSWGGTKTPPCVKRKP